jgi:hypothetical protein
MTKSEKTEQKQMRDNIKNLLQSSDVANPMLALQLLTGQPHLMTKEIQNLVIGAKFRHDLCELDEVWYGSRQGQKFSDLTDEEFLYVVNIYHRICCIRKIRGISELRHKHLYHFDNRQAEIERECEKRASPSKTFRLEVEKYNKRFFSKKIVMYDLVPALESIEWDKFPTSEIIHIANNYRPHTGDIILYQYNEDLRFLFHRAPFMQQLVKRPEIVQAKKGHYYDIRNYQKPAYTAPIHEKVAYHMNA